MAGSLEGQLALITGGSRGIGQEVARVLGRQGALVVATATTPAGAERIDADLAAHGIRGTGVALDVTDDAAMSAVLAQIQASHGAPTILVNNAGITRDQLLLRMKDDDWDDVMATNLRAVYRLSKLCVRDMLKARFGRIINITSVVGVMGNAGQTNYAAAKAGVAGFTRAMAREVAARQVTVNCVAPGFISTDMTEGLNDTHRDALMQQIPAGRLGVVADVAAAVAYLAGPDAGYVTGQILHVNGGMWMG
ncbi:MULTISPECIES: 3-oxoacyl-ACP reductase FabG [Acidithiobacillus]|jgi:3-oxoacyl-[acyl-carrier protein] reductase|uniref:3-oxoacyl-[acyl-carrier-protein] reductase n=2 Tax=Acidithiobacillus TaxID=119977 RepID=A0A179B786_ACIFR|nr:MULTISPECIES: 3-oxoacyl-ACP reductase FabG [Acidithiobacillus]MBU2855043.1 3-oxoacyl-ACP reductase FabG [Acidithiobacillus ferriphilus]MBW9247536.1 3-oxoacyl-ACP reductase FabG [Acidithiobacillus ferriphilus]MBW9254959.1 3-oxoacyl-ACP reductase FabG [Acidithiobacillus ferriphilus]MEB8487900.1 3-oxoacyl-ACP reductase FabG [Acidithiobacillus ferriphilus]MEB8489008.1 3-oxoacyl-ACP reductase FabG [Acidithiobacillus ferriphilus]